MEELINMQIIDFIYGILLWSPMILSFAYLIFLCILTLLMGSQMKASTITILAETIVLVFIMSYLLIKSFYPIWVTIIYDIMLPVVLSILIMIIGAWNRR